MCDHRSRCDHREAVSASWHVPADAQSTTKTGVDGDWFGADQGGSYGSQSYLM